MIIINRLKILRENKGLLQKDIARILGISSSAYGFYETGARNMSAKTAEKLAHFFDVSIEYLLGTSEYNSTEKEDIELLAFYNGYKDMSVADKEIIKATFDAIVKKNKENKKK